MDPSSLDPCVDQGCFRDQSRLDVLGVGGSRHTALEAANSIVSKRKKYHYCLSIKLFLCNRLWFFLLFLSFENENTPVISEM
jgi:hypothetical protein